MTTEGPGAELVRYTTQLAHAMGKVVVAEGVEHADQWDILTRIGCDHAQGYAIARPLAPEAFDRWLEEWQAGVGAPLAGVRR